MNMKLKSALTAASLVLSLALVACGGASEEGTSSGKKFSGRTLTIYNCDDYISGGEDGYRDLIGEFEEETGCKINYYTYDTNETMYNQFTLQKEGTYDLICTSEYTIQKMIKEGLVDKYENIAKDVPNYEEYASKTIRQKLKDMTVDYDEDGDGTAETVCLDDYVVGYMWGTLGLIYDADYTDTIQEDIKSWDIIWDPTYKDVISLKNSMRDTYVAGLMHAYESDPKMMQLKAAYESEDATQEDYDAYNDYIQEVFDFKLDGSEASEKENYAKIAAVKEQLISAKDNIFGFEVDSGKNDIITGKIKIDLAWSGDACYSIDTAEEERDDLTLEYYVPEDGSNIWYDGWTLPKGGQKDIAYAFLNFLSDPQNAADNMAYIGYTPFIVGRELFDLTCNWYGVAEYSDVYAYNYEEDEEGNIVTQDMCLYDGKLYACIKPCEDGGVSPEDADYWEEESFDAAATYYEGDMTCFNGVLYNCITEEENGVTGSSLSDENVWEKVEAYSLSHIYGDSLDGEEAVLYPYYGSGNHLSCQYPDERTIARCAIMNDFGDYNDSVIIMWGQVRAATDMTMFYVILIVVAVAIIAVAAVMIFRKQKSARNKRALSAKQAK